MTEATLIFQVDAALKAEFANAAKSPDRTGAQPRRDLVREQQDAAGYDVWFRRQVQKGVDQANVGELVPDEDVQARFAVRREATRRRTGASD